MWSNFFFDQSVEFLKILDSPVKQILQGGGQYFAFFRVFVPNIVPISLKMVNRPKLWPICVFNFFYFLIFMIFWKNLGSIFFFAFFFFWFSNFWRGTYSTENVSEKYVVFTDFWTFQNFRPPKIGEGGRIWV